MMCKLARPTRMTRPGNSACCTLSQGSWHTLCFQVRSFAEHKQSIDFWMQFDLRLIQDLNSSSPVGTHTCCMWMGLHTPLLLFGFPEFSFYLLLQSNSMLLPEWSHVDSPYKVTYGLNQLWSVLKLLAIHQFRLCACIQLQKHVCMPFMPQRIFQLTYWPTRLGMYGYMF